MTNSARAEIAPKVATARAILDPWLATNPVPVKKKIHLVLWTPKDREPAPRYRERLSAIFVDIRKFYAHEMERIGFGPRTIGLDTMDDGLLRVHLVRGLKDYTNYAVASGSAIHKECLPTLDAAGLNPAEELIVIFCNMSNWDETQRTISQNSPYYASGTAWQVDSPILDLDFLTEKGKNVRDGQYGNISLGRYSSIFIGGACHELGHSLGLPHNKERADERAAFGTALMGSGNRTYGEQLRGESKGSFLTLAHALRLAAQCRLDSPVVSQSQRHERRRVLLRDDGRRGTGRDLLHGVRLASRLLRDAGQQPDRSPHHLQRVGQRRRSREPQQSRGHQSRHPHGQGRGRELRRLRQRRHGRSQSFEIQLENRREAEVHRHRAADERDVHHLLRLLVSSREEGVDAHLLVARAQGWRWLRGLYSFSENFGGHNGHLPRKALYGNQWLRTDTGAWHEVTTASFSHDGTGKTDRLDRFMGVENGQFFLHHGGFVNGFTKYGEKFTRPGSSQRPAELELFAAARRP